MEVLMSIHMKPDGRWYVHWRAHGQRHTKVFGRGEEGRKNAEDLNAVLSEGQITLGKLVELFTVHHCSRSVNKRYPEEIKILVKRLGLNDHPISKITERDLQTAVINLKKKDQKPEAGREPQPISPVTMNRYLSYLKILLNFAVKRSLIAKNPLEHWAKTSEPPRSLRLNAEDLRAIYAHAKPHLQWVIKCAANLGCRPGPSELFSIRWSDVDLKNGVVKVPCAKKDGQGGYRVVPVSEIFLNDLIAASEIATTPFLCEYMGKRIDKIRRSLKTATRKAGITYDVRMYDLRHLYATTLLRGGANLKAVSELLGHRSTKMTVDVYAHAIDEDKRRAAQLTPSF
jgi:integrase